MIEPETITNQPPTTRPDPLALAYELDGVPAWRKDLSRQVMRGYVGFWGFVGGHWLWLVNLVNLACLIAAFLAPLLALAGFDAPANGLYSLFHYVCVQNPNHSFYIGDRQMCICERCMAIYGGMLVAGLVYCLLRRRIQPLKTWQFLLFFCPPIAVDSLTQLFGWRESTWELRFLTGGLFAVGAVWTLYPLLESRMAGLRRWANREQALSGEA